MAFARGTFFGVIKNYCSKPGSTVVPLNVKLITNYNSVLMLVIMFATYGFDGKLTDINCSPPNVLEKSAMSKWWDSYCLKETQMFLVKKALDPKVRGDVLFPGIGPYERGVDGIIEINYYNKIWLLFGAYIVLSYVPYIFVKVTR